MIEILGSLIGLVFIVFLGYLVVQSALVAEDIRQWRNKTGKYYYDEEN